MTEGWTGADLESMVNESAYTAVRMKAQFIQNEYLIESYTKLHSMRY